jgi:protocatechuate 3,4-dioxygenase alpha subunit
MSLQMIPSQTVGPYLHIGFDWLNTDNLAPEGVAGERVVIEGRLFDGNGQPISDGVIEVWQANSHGKYASPEDKRDLPLEAAFRGFGRIPTDANGVFRFTTIKPGRVPAAGGKLQAPHIVVSVLGRGIIKRLATRIYFPDEASNAEDPVLSQVPADRRSTLIARHKGPGALEWNVVIQGEASGQGETVFFDV